MNDCFLKLAILHNYVEWVMLKYFRCYIGIEQGIPTFLDLRRSNGQRYKFLQTYYPKDTETLYHYFMYSLVSLLSGINSSLAMHSLLVTIIIFFLCWSS